MRRGLAAVSVVVFCWMAVFSLPLRAEQAAAAGGQSAAEPEEQLLARARALHQRFPVLDTHVDIAGPHYATDRLDPGIEQPQLKCDLVKMARGGVDGVFLAVFVAQGPRNAEGYRRAMEAALGKFEAIHRLVKRYPERCALATSPDDVERIIASGRRAIMIGVENGYPIGDDLGNVEKFHRLGARYITLCHNGHNQLCDSCTPRRSLGDAAEEHGGLSELGKKVVAEMNRLGMMIDVSHLAETSFWDVLQCSQAPVIASHSGCRALCDHPRNLTDRQLAALAARGGVIQVVAVPSFLKARSPARLEAVRQLARRLQIPWRGDRPDLAAASEEQRQAFREGLDKIDAPYPRAELQDFVNHIDHAVRVAGIDHVGVGSDFDGGGGVPGFNDHGDAYRVTAELLRRGYSPDEIARIWGGNLLRVWRKVEQIAAGKGTR